MLHLRKALPGTLSSALVLTAILAGCSNEDKSTSFKSISNDLSPDRGGLSQRKIDVNKDLAVVNDSNFRAMSDDFGRTLYTDHPSRLSPFPIVSLNGLPR